MALLSLLAPRRCAGCLRPGPALCDRCRAALVRVGPVGCERCGAPGPWPVRRCAECAGRRLGFARARSAVVYDGRLRPLVAAWKEGGRRDLVEPFAELVAETVPRPAVAYLTFVPGDRERGLHRGHAPPEGLARALGRRWELPCGPLLRRVVGPGRPRQAELGRAARRSGLRGAFAPLGEVPSTTCLVDDVYTTGATAAACAAGLRAGGAQWVEVVSLARAVR